MPLINTGWMDRVASGISFVISLLGTVSTPEEATRTVTGGEAIAGWRFNADGTTDRRQGSWATGYDDWATPTGYTPGNDYQIRASKESGTETALSTGNLATWENLSSTITYELSNNAQDNSTIDIVLKIEVRDTSTQTIQDTGYYKISCTSNSGGGTTTTTTTVTTETTVSQ